MHKSLTLALLTVFLLAATSRADVANFDGIDVSGGPQELFTFDGFTALNLAVIDKDWQPGTGYEFGNLSPENSAFNNFAQPVTISRTSGSHFNFVGASFAGAWRDQLTIFVSGFLNNQLTDFKLFEVDSTGPSFVTLDFTNIDTLIIASFGGVDAGYGGGPGDQHFVMDDFTYVVPEPSSMVIAALLGLGAFARRRR